MATKYAYLENTTGGHNKFYEMTENPGSNTWTAKWGAIGKSPSSQTYNMNVWYKKYDEKIKKGYVDKTHLKTPPKPKFTVNQEHLDKVNKVLVLLTAHAHEVESGIELVRDVSIVRETLKDPKGPGKGNLDADDMKYLNDVWKKIKHYAKK